MITVLAACSITPPASTPIRPEAAGLLVPVPFVAEGLEYRYRIASVFQLDGGGWIGRYTVHLPTTYPLDAFKQPSAATLSSLQAELTEAASQLRELVERGARGELGLTPMNQRLAISWATFLGWLLITLLGEQLGSGAHQALSETVSRGLGWPFLAAAAFVLAVAAWQRWRDIGLFFIALRLRTGSLWPCIVVHGLWDCAAFLVAMSSSKDPATNTAPTDAMSLAPILLVLPNALYGLWLMRQVGKSSATEESP